MNSEKVILCLNTSRYATSKAFKEMLKEADWNVYESGLPSSSEDIFTRHKPHLIALMGTVAPPSDFRYFQEEAEIVLAQKDTQTPLLAILDVPQTEQHCAIDLETRLLNAGIDLVLFLPVSPKRLHVRMSSLLRRVHSNA